MQWATVAIYSRLHIAAVKSVDVNETSLDCSQHNKELRQFLGQLGFSKHIFWSLQEFTSFLTVLCHPWYDISAPHRWRRVQEASDCSWPWAAHLVHGSPHQSCCYTSGSSRTPPGWKAGRQTDRQTDDEMSLFHADRCQNFNPASPAAQVLL